MERLTKKDGYGRATLIEPGFSAIDIAMNRLADYEDTMPLKRAKELSQAEKDGRLVVLPCKDYCWSIRGDIILDIIRANCRAAHEKEAALKKMEDEDNEAD